MITKKSRIITVFKNCLNLAFGFVLLVFLERIFEAFYISAHHSHDKMVYSQLKGIWADFNFLAGWICLLILLSAILSLIHKRLGTILFVGIAFVYLIFHLALLIFFNEAITALTYHNLMDMSQKQLGFIVEIYGFSYWQLLLLIPLVLTFGFIWYKATKLLKQKYRSIFLVILLFSSFISNLFLEFEDVNYESEVEYQLIENKTKIFINSYFEYNKEADLLLNADIKEALDTYYQLNEKENLEQYEFPFFDSSSTENYLEEYFVKQDSAPNVVFIIAESLGRMFSGPNARLGSFTPFLDSLATEGLYWENMLSNAERTFGAIPNLMAGVPEGSKGFLNLRSSMPDHLSLPLLLKEANGYETSFFCGAIKKFDFMDEYLMFQRFDHLHGKSSFGSNTVMKEIESQDGEIKQFNWGAEDLKVFEESMAMLDGNKVNAPFFNLYLTTSFHEPFAYENEERFIQLAKDRINELSPSAKADYLKNIVTFAALMYMDYSISQCIDFYKKRPDFENTIFVIVGDHAIKFMSNESRIEKYHVPLLIYSPLLKKSASFKNVVSHKDVPSALQALLRDNFNLHMPEFSISQSNNLRTDSTFMVKSNHAFMRADKRITSYLYGNNFYVGDKNYAIEAGLQLKDDKNTPSLEKRLDNYKVISNYVCKENSYIPPEKYSAYVKTKYLLNINENFEVRNKVIDEWINPVYQTNQYSYSGSRSISNAAERYFKIVSNLKVNPSVRYRVKLKFKLKCASDYPVLHFVVHDKEDTILDDQTSIIDLDDCFIRETQKQDWKEVETSYWLLENTLNSHLTIYFHMKSDKEFFMDDLEIEIQEF